mmetsp:Transcript_29711/g.76917  ORF Transcript_29711/g.76917 Transcript_29711/m.76917 type:complete len:233 (-) Transcript_29711:119-817(-)
MAPEASLCSVLIAHSGRRPALVTCAAGGRGVRSSRHSALPFEQALLGRVDDVFLAQLAYCLEDTVRLVRAVALVLELLLVLTHRDLCLCKDREEHREHDEDGDEEVAQEEQRVQVAARVVHDRVDVKISEERAEERDESGDLVLVALHKGAQLDEEHHREGQHRDDKRDAEEKQVDRALAQHAGGEAHLGHELREELEHFEELDAEAEGEVHLHLAEGRHHLPVVEIADCGA